MKKINLFVALMFTIVTLVTSCKKDDTITPDDPNTGLISLTELNGMWNFYSYQYNNKVYSNCDEISYDAVTRSKGKIILSLNIRINASGYGGANLCDLLDACFGNTTDNFLTLDTKLNQITLDNGIVWQIISYDKINKVLVLKLIAPDIKTLLVNGVYTLNKQ